MTEKGASGKEEWGWIPVSGHGNDGGGMWGVGSRGQKEREGASPRFLAGPRNDREKGPWDDRERRGGRPRESPIRGREWQNGKTRNGGARMKRIEMDYSKRCWEEQEKVHNRWHPDIPPALEVEPEEEVYLQTRDALDGQITPESTLEDVPGD